jgi:hypothetical protein
LTLQIYHGWSINARLTLIGQAQRSIERIGRAARPTDNPGCRLQAGRVCRTPHDSKAFAKLLELEGQGQGHKEAVVKELHEFVVELLCDSSDALLSEVS